MYSIYMYICIIKSANKSSKLYFFFHTVFSLTVYFIFLGKKKNMCSVIRYTRNPIYYAWKKKALPRNVARLISCNRCIPSSFLNKRRFFFYFFSIDYCADLLFHNNTSCLLNYIIIIIIICTSGFRFYKCIACELLYRHNFTACSKNLSPLIWSTNWSKN